MRTLAILDTTSMTPRARLVRLDLAGTSFDYRAGQAVLVGAHEHTVRRPYSLASAPHEAARTGALELLIGVEGGEAPGTHLPDLSAGTLVDVEGPVGGFVFPETIVERHLLFVAGGTGIAPLRAMLHEALARDRDWRIGVLYSARAPEEFAFDVELRGLAAAGRIGLVQTVTREADGWDGARGRVGLEQIAELVETPETLCFACGPHALVEHVPRLLEQAGIAPFRIRIEDWS